LEALLSLKETSFDKLSCSRGWQREKDKTAYTARAVTTTGDFRCYHQRTVENPGCVKTQKIESDETNFQKDSRPKSPRRLDRQKRHLVECPFYVATAAERFYTAKTRNRPSWYKVRVREISAASSGTA
jgi:hypothetical protein